MHTGSDVIQFRVQAERLQAYPTNSKETTVVMQQSQDIIMNIIQIICKKAEKNARRRAVTSGRQKKMID